jgi:hypothetical protein
MNTQGFQPFEDRLSRDIRNELSEGLAIAIETGKHDTLEATKDKYRQQPLAEHYRAYLEDRCHRYDQALAAIAANSVTDPIQRGCILWNLDLFFEVHEVLEHAWYSASGPMKLTLQALVRSAGVYIKREYGYFDSATRIAGKAVAVLTENKALLMDYFDPQILIEALPNGDAPPPLLLPTTKK